MNVPLAKLKDQPEADLPLESIGNARVALHVLEGARAMTIAQA